MPTTWSDLHGRRVGVWGYGVEGSAVVDMLRAGAQLTIVDDNPPSPETFGTRPNLPPLDVTTDAEALLSCEVVVKSPGISRSHPVAKRLVEADIPLLGGHGIWLNGSDRSHVACVTGTKGKSTTASVVGQLFSSLGIDGQIGGNIGAPPFAADAAEATYWCLELSSFQVTDIERGPRIVALTSLGSDHVDWHGGHDRYVADKLTLTSKPGVELILAAADDPGLRAVQDRIDAPVEWVEVDERSRRIATALGLRGDHNTGNVAIALRIVESLCEMTIGTVEIDAIHQAAPSYVGLPCRLTTIASIHGVEYVDDALSTNVLPVISALDVFSDRPTAWIMGGADRGIDYSALITRVERAANPLLVVAMGTPDNGHDLADQIDVDSLPIEIVRVADLQEAVLTATNWAKKQTNAVVLLSPGAPTWSDSATVQRYPNYKAKSDDFAKSVRSLG